MTQQTYSIIAIIAFFFLIAQSRMKPTGSILLALFWPAIIVAVVFYGVKKLAFKRGPSRKHFEVETLAILATAAPIIIYLVRPELFRLL